METQLDSWRRQEYYGEVRQFIPDESIVTGQDLVNRQMLEDEPAGTGRDGYSSATMLALVDHREFSSNAEFPEIFTQQVRKLAGPGLNRARSVDAALVRADLRPREDLGDPRRRVQEAVSVCDRGQRDRKPHRGG